MIQFDKTWYNLTQLGTTWCTIKTTSNNLKQLDATWRNLMQLEVTWRNLKQLNAIRLNFLFKNTQHETQRWCLPRLRHRLKTNRIEMENSLKKLSFIAIIVLCSDVIYLPVELIRLICEYSYLRSIDEIYFQNS